jgi:hypothetical protein
MEGDSALSARTVPKTLFVQSERTAHWEPVQTEEPGEAHFAQLEGWSVSLECPAPWALHSLVESLAPWAHPQELARPTPSLHWGAEEAANHDAAGSHSLEIQFPDFVQPAHYAHCH